VTSDQDRAVSTQPVGPHAVPSLVAEKLAAFDQISDEVLSSFPYLQEVHGQRRFASFPIEATVRYLHSLWICDRKDMLLSVPNSGRRPRGSRERFERHEGQHALELLCQWQEGQTANVVSFLELKLDYAPFGEISRNIEAATERGESALARRLVHGRTILFNRTHNLVCALRAIFAVAPGEMIVQVQAACAKYSHTIEQCSEQLAAMESPIYALIPHPALARCNMLLMNGLGMKITNSAVDRPGRRTASVQRPRMPQHGYAEIVVPIETTMLNEFVLQV
jgi:hypothetical protein